MNNEKSLCADFNTGKVLVYKKYRDYKEKSDMELKHLTTKKLLRQKVYHPIYGEIGEVQDLLNHGELNYIVFKERSVQAADERSSTYRAIPANFFYWHRKTGELRVNFGAQWITEAPVFTPADLDQDFDTVRLILIEYYKNNTLWMGRRHS